MLLAPTNITKILPIIRLEFYNNKKNVRTNYLKYFKTVLIKNNKKIKKHGF